MIRWRGEPDPRHVEAVDAYWVSAAEHGMNASTFTARVIASTGADVAACLSGAVGAMSRPAARRRPVPGAAHDRGGRAAPATPRGYVKGVLDRGERLMGFGHRVYRAEDPRARVLRAHRQRARRAALRGRRGAGEGRAGGAARPPARPGARDQRRVLGRGRARLRRGPAAHVHADVHLRPHRRLVGAHPRAEAHRPADPARPRATSAPARARREEVAGWTIAAGRADPGTSAEPDRRREPDACAAA